MFCQHRSDTMFWQPCLVAEDGVVRALYASYAQQKGEETVEDCAGMPSAVWWPWVGRVAIAQEALSSGKPHRPLTDVFTLDAEMETLVLVSGDAGAGETRTWRACSLQCSAVLSRSQRPSNTASPRSGSTGCAESTMTGGSVSEVRSRVERMPLECALRELGWKLE